MVGVTSKSPRLNVGLTVSTENPSGIVQNLTKSSNCLSRDNTKAGSGEGRVSLTKCPRLSASFTLCIIAKTWSATGSPCEVLKAFD